MESDLSPQAALDLLRWQIELGATEAIGDSPVNRYDVPATPPRKSSQPQIASQATSQTKEIPNIVVDAVGEAHTDAGQSTDLNTLRAAMAAYDHCELKRGARQLVFADGNPAAKVMIIGEAPGRDEDMQGKPFVGRAGQMLDRMLAAIDMSRQADAPKDAVYITNVLPWRPPQNRNPKPDEIAMMLPFVQRHVDLIDPQLIILMGNISCQAGLGKHGITRLRGTWAEAYGRPALSMFHPAYLLRSPHTKREAWADLLDLRARLDELN